MCEERLIREPHVWDLHIHTPLGTPEKRNYGGISTDEFITNLINIYNSASNRIGMISFTDHNQINVEAYTLFRERSCTSIIPGIEIDVYLSSDAPTSKHVIFYFSEKEFDDLAALNTLITDFIRESNKVVFDALVTHLIAHKKQFAISPHAFKQGKRSIDFEWIDPETTYSGITAFSGLFFPFWEAAGKSEICKAQEFLNSEYSEISTEQSVIAFSDSADYKKIKSYIENPHQFFLCLDSYKGLLLAGSDPSRIIYSNQCRPAEKPAEKIKELSLKSKPFSAKSDRATIEFSDRLNVIIGGRGKGKSALLDAIVFSLSPQQITERARSTFVKKFDVQLKNFNNAQFVPDISFIYYHQAYIAELFKGDRNTHLMDFFREPFSEIDNLTDSISDVYQAMELLIASRVAIPEAEYNVTDDLHALVVLPQQTKYFSISNKRNAHLPLYANKDTNKETGYISAIKDILPEGPELWDEDVNAALNEFMRLFLTKVCLHNFEDLLSTTYPARVKRKIEDVQKKKSTVAEKHVEGKRKIIQKLRSIYAKELERVYQINRLYKIPPTLTELKTSYTLQSGEEDNRFYFVIAINKEHPVEYALRKIYSSVDKRSLTRDSCHPAELFTKYAFDRAFSEKLNGQMTLQSLQQSIDSLEDLRHDKTCKILYKTKSGICDLHQTSPGTQTNALMECIFHSNSTVPLFLDQPEDNIDNEARYQKLTKWIRTQKNHRQIIVVTHDANIVINGDAECVIIADHDSDSFKYCYGALEYGDILDRASTILDGGKTAIKRRMAKYGE